MQTGITGTTTHSNIDDLTEHNGKWAVYVHTDTETHMQCESAKMTLL